MGPSKYRVPPCAHRASWEGSPRMGQKQASSPGAPSLRVAHPHSPFFLLAFVDFPSPEEWASLALAFPQVSKSL